MFATKHTQKVAKFMLQNKTLFNLASVHEIAIWVQMFSVCVCKRIFVYAKRLAPSSCEIKTKMPQVHTKNQQKTISLCSNEFKLFLILNKKIPNGIYNTTKKESRHTHLKHFGKRKDLVLLF